MPNLIKNWLSTLKLFKIYKGGHPFETQYIFAFQQLQQLYLNNLA